MNRPRQENMLWTVVQHTEETQRRFYTLNLNCYLACSFCKTFLKPCLKVRTWQDREIVCFAKKICVRETQKWLRKKTYKQFSVFHEKKINNNKRKETIVFQISDSNVSLKCFMAIRWREIRSQQMESSIIDLFGYFLKFWRLSLTLRHQQLLTAPKWRVTDWRQFGGWAHIWGQILAS